MNLVRCPSQLQRRLEMVFCVCALLVAVFLMAPRCHASSKEGVSGFEDQLKALDGVDAMVYFRLAEEVAFESHDDAGASLAKRLFVIAFTLDREHGVGALGSSVCLALAPLAEDADDQRWLRTMATSLEQSPDAVRWPLWSAPHAPALDDEQTLAEGLERTRAGDYRRALKLLESEESRRAMNRLPEKMARLVRTVIQRAPDRKECRTCHRRRIIRTGADRVAAVCPTCDADPGPDLDGEALISQLTVEAKLLRASPQAWSAQIRVQEGRALRDLDPGSLAEWAGVDPDKTIWREGVWRAPAEDATGRE